MAYTTIDDPSAHFQTQLYTGNGNNNKAITNSGNSDLQPDWIWFKETSHTDNHLTSDTNRGVDRQLYPNLAAGRDTDTNKLESFDSDGFTLNNGGDVNEADHTYVAWQWKTGSAANDTNGDITTSVTANTTAGISLATYSGNGGSGQTLGHGLGAEPDMVWFKCRETATSWRVYTRIGGASKFLNLESNAAEDTSSNIFPSVSSTTIGVEQNDVMNKNGAAHIMYSFRSIQGYSKIGTYVGNGNANGTFIYTGFKPAFLLFKAKAGTENWGIFDNQRTTQNGNPRDIYLLASTTAANSSESDSVDFLSNGFKWRIDSGFRNGDGVTFLYMAFAESPFVSSEGVPTTAE